MCGLVTHSACHHDRLEDAQEARSDTVPIRPGNMNVSLKQGLCVTVQRSGEWSRQQTGHPRYWNNWVSEANRPCAQPLRRKRAGWHLRIAVEFSDTSRTEGLQVAQDRHRKLARQPAIVWRVVPLLCGASSRYCVAQHMCMLVCAHVRKAGPAAWLPFVM